jgi:hypothetical protein
MVRHPGGIIFSKLAETFARLVLRWRSATSADRYRPEKHYMRGRGPKAFRKAGGDGGQSPTSP